MKFLLALLLLATPAWAETNPDAKLYSLPSVSVTVPTATTPTWANVDTLRELALAKAASNNLPTVLQQVSPSLSLAQAQAQAATVAVGTDWLDAYTVADETLTPQYTLRVSLRYNPTKVNQLLTTLPIVAKNTSPTALTSATTALPTQTFTLTLEGTAAQGAQLQSILAKLPGTSSRVSQLTHRTITWSVSTTSTDQQLTQFLQKNALTVAPLPENALRVVF
jgi:hypothetical protein